MSARSRRGRPGRDLLTEAERRFVVEEFHGGGSRTEIVNRILNRLEKAGKAVSRRSAQRWAVELDYIARHRWRDPLTDEQWQQVEQDLGHLPWVTRRSVDSWILANSAWKQEQARGQTLALMAQPGFPSPAPPGGKPPLAELLRTISVRFFLHDILEFIGYPRHEWIQRQESFIRHLEAFSGGQGVATANNPDRPARPAPEDRFVALERLAITLLGPLQLHFHRQMLEAEAFLRQRGIEPVPPEAHGNPRWLDLAQLHHGFPRWAAFVASCRLLELAVREDLPPDWRWAELARQTTEVEVEWGLLRVRDWLGSRLTTDQAVELRQWVWQEADRIRNGEVALQRLSDVRGHVRQLAEAWKGWWEAD